MNNEHPQEGHLLACVLKDDSWVIRLASEAVGGHHHGQVVHIHLGYSNVGWLSKHLQEAKTGAKLSVQKTLPWSFYVTESESLQVKGLTVLVEICHHTTTCF